MHRFRVWMTRLGFAWDEESGVLVNTSSGSRLQRDADLPIWTEHDESGDELEHFWVSQGNLSSGVVIPVPVWNYFQGKSQISYLMLEENERFQRYRWADIRREMAEDRIESFATGYFFKRREPGVGGGSG